MSDTTSKSEIVATLFLLCLFLFQTNYVFDRFQANDHELSIYNSYDNVFEREMTEHKEKYDSCINKWQTQEMIDICHRERLGRTFESELFFEEWRTWESQQKAERRSKFYASSNISIFFNLFLSLIFGLIITAFLEAWWIYPLFVAIGRKINIQIVIK